jgi:hypothetical protein
MAWDTEVDGHKKLVFGSQTAELTNGDLVSRSTIVSAIVKHARGWGLNNFIVDLGDETISDPQDLPEVDELPDVITLKPYAKAG